MSYLNDAVRRQESFTNENWCTICGQKNVDLKHRHHYKSASNQEQDILAARAPEADPVMEAMYNTMLKEMSGPQIINEPQPHNLFTVYPEPENNEDIAQYMACHKLLREKGAEAMRKKFPAELCDRCELEILENITANEAKNTRAREKPFKDSEWYRYEKH